MHRIVDRAVLVVEPDADARAEVRGCGTDRAWAAASGADAYVLKKNGAARMLEVAGKLGRRP
jgi:hypothetical protein